MENLSLRVGKGDADVPHGDVVEDPNNPRFADDPVAALQLYQERGYHIEPRVWDADDIARLTRVMPTMEDPSSKGAIVQNPHFISPEFMAAARAPKVVSALRAILGQSISGLQGQGGGTLPRHGRGTAVPGQNEGLRHSSFENDFQRECRGTG